MRVLLITTALIAGTLCEIKAQGRGASVAAQQGPAPKTIKYTIEGQVLNAPTDRDVYIYYTSDRERDSVKVNGGSFQIRREAKEGSQLYLSKYLQGAFDPAFVTDMYVDKGQIQVKLDYNDFSTIQVKGSKTHDEFLNWKQRVQAQDAAVKPLSRQYNEENGVYMTLTRELKALQQKVDEKKELLENLRGQMSAHHAEMVKQVPEFVRDFPNSPVSASLLYSHLTQLPLELAIELYEELGSLPKSSRYGNMIGERLAQIKGGSPGSTASIFTTTDIDGKPLSLEDFRGQYVLLDFWASWCVPCRKGNPHLIELHNKYHKQGFEIIGISDDDSNHAAWKKAVADDQIGIWKHVLRGLKRSPNGGYDKSEDISEPYGISTLPTKILIDPNGVIIGRYGSNGGTDADLDKKLAKIFN